jgi:hypothetical protein
MKHNEMKHNEMHPKEKKPDNARDFFINNYIGQEILDYVFFIKGNPTAELIEEFRVNAERAWIRKNK